MKLFSSILVIIGAIILVSAATAQTPYIYAYSTISYNSSTNTITGYSYSQPAYTNAIYYQTGVSATIKDDNNNLLTSGQATTSQASPAQINLQVQGNGCGYYHIGAGHWEVMTNYVTNAYINGGYQSGYYDPYFYNYDATHGSSSNIYTGSHSFYGNGPAEVWGSTFTLLGSTWQETDGDCNLGPSVDFALTSPANDGSTATFSSTVKHGTPTGYLWDYTTPNGSGNSPNLSYTSATSSNTNATAK